MSERAEQDNVSRSRGSQKPKRPARSLHRTRSHEASQAEAELETPPEIPDHPLIPQSDPICIETNEALDDLIGHVQETGFFAYDTEFIGELSYYPRLCLIQIATAERVCLVDPLADVDLTGIWQLIADPMIETIVHAGGIDLEPVHRHLKKPPANIFDTQIAAGFAGLSYPLGLARLIEEIFSLKVGKGLTFTHWDHRPLSKVHTRYAADDVRYLPAMRSVLLKNLESSGHTACSDEECVGMARDSDRDLNLDFLYRKIKGAMSLRPKRLAVLRALTKLRENAARDHDVPPRSLVKDSVLMDLSKSPIKSVEKLGKVPGLSRRMAQAYGEAIVSTTLEALDLPKDKLPSLPDFVKETPQDQVRVDSLNGIASSLCHGQGISPALAVNRKDVSQLYQAFCRDRGVDGCRLMQGWRRQYLGLPLHEFLLGNSRVTLGWVDGKLSVEP